VSSWLARLKSPVFSQDSANKGPAKVVRRGG
jgi:hypothetical protein